MPAKGTKSTKTTKSKVTRPNVAKSSSKTGLLSKKVKFNWKIAAVIGVILVAALGYLFVRLSEAGSGTYPASKLVVIGGTRVTKQDGSSAVQSVQSYDPLPVRSRVTTQIPASRIGLDTKYCVEYATSGSATIKFTHTTTKSINRVGETAFPVDASNGKKTRCMDVQGTTNRDWYWVYVTIEADPSVTSFVYSMSAQATNPTTPSPAPGAKSPAPAPQAGICEGQNAFGPGSQGGCVRIIQQRLTDLGYQPGTVDGIYGQNTANAVKVFQQRSGLTQDGVVGPQTWNALTSSNAARKQ